MSTILGISTAVLAVIGLFVGLIGLFGKGSLGQTVRGFLQAIPVGNAKLWSIIIIIAGLAGGALGTTMAYVGGLGSSASLGGSDKSSNVVSAMSCELVTPTETVPLTQNITFRADPTDKKHYYADVKHDNGASSINGTLFCKDNRQDISKGAVHDVYVKSGAFKNEVSTTDSNTYYILATSASASKVPGFSWQQTAYISDSGSSNTGATTSSPSERSDIVFAQDETTQYVGYYLTLPGATAFGYLNNKSSVDVKFVADGNTVATLTITKTTD